MAAAESSPSRHALALAQCAAAAVDGWSYRETLLHPLAAMPLDSVRLQGALRGLSGDEVEALLAYLCKWVAKYGRSVGELAATAVLPQELLFPTQAQVRPDAKHAGACIHSCLRPAAVRLYGCARLVGVMCTEAWMHAWQGCR